MESSPTPGQGLSVSAFKGCSSSLRVLSFWSVGTSRSELLRCPRNFSWSGDPVQFLVTLPGWSLWFFRTWLELRGAPTDVWRTFFWFWKRSSYWPLPRLGVLVSSMLCHIVALLPGAGVRCLFFRPGLCGVVSGPLLPCSSVCGLHCTGPTKRVAIAMGDCYILCGRSGVTWSAWLRIVSNASGSFLPQGVARRSYRRPLAPDVVVTGMPALGYGTVCLCPGSSVLSLRLFFEKNLAVILVGGRGCGTRTHPCGAATEGLLPLGSSLPFTGPVCAGPGFTRACSPWHITAYRLETGPWVMRPCSFSYHPPPSHGMSRLVVRVCLHILKCCLYYFLEILDYISSESLVPC